MTKGCLSLQVKARYYWYYKNILKHITKLATSNSKMLKQFSQIYKCYT